MQPRWNCLHFDPILLSLVLCVSVLLFECISFYQPVGFRLVRYIYIYKVVGALQATVKNQKGTLTKRYRPKEEREEGKQHAPLLHTHTTSRKYVSCPGISLASPHRKSAQDSGISGVAPWLGAILGLSMSLGGSVLFGVGLNPSEDCKIPHIFPGYLSTLGNVDIF